MYIQLNQSDYDAIAELIDEVDDDFSGSIDYSDIGLEVTFSKYVVAHQDTDYYNGTGAWEVDSVEFYLTSITCGDIEVKYNHDRLVWTVKQCLKKS